MPSIKSRLFTLLLRHTRKKAFASPEGMQRRLVAARKKEDYRPPSNLERRVDIKERKVGTMPVYEVSAKGSSPNKRIVYLHGGAYLFEISAHHWKLIAELAERLPVQISVAIYPLSPEHKVDEIISASMALYRDLLTNVSAENIILMGDSAGANLAVVMAMQAAQEKLPLPNRMVLISPPFDRSMSNPEIHEVEKKDPWLAVSGAVQSRDLNIGDLAPDDWRVSPIFGDISVMPPMMLLTGTHDITNPDTRVFAQNAKALGVEIELVEKEGMFHVWPLIDMPEGREARDKMVEYLSR